MGLYTFTIEPVTYLFKRLYTFTIKPMTYLFMGLYTFTIRTCDLPIYGALHVYHSNLWLTYLWGFTRLPLNLWVTYFWGFTRLPLNLRLTCLWGFTCLPLNLRLTYLWGFTRLPFEPVTYLFKRLYTFTFEPHFIATSLFITNKIRLASLAYFGPD